MGIDWGEKRMGIAISSPDWQFTFARPQLLTVNFKLLTLLKEESPVGIIVGLPLRLDGTDSETTKQVRDFATELSKQTEIPILLFDESLTSFEAATNNPESLDSESARIMLENAIAQINRGKPIADK